jgi:hypothetical protein
MTILELLEDDGIIPKKTKSSYGPKYESPCPDCGGNNCFQYGLLLIGAIEPFGDRRNGATL